MTVSRPIISNQQARRIFMARQGLCLPPHAPQRKDDLRALIHQLGFVQMDSIRTVERAHHMILFARNQNYQQDHLRQLLEDDRQIFEHWTHDAALIPVEFYPHWRHRFSLAEVHLRERWRRIRPKDNSGGRRIGFEDMMDQVRNHVSRNGPTLARDLKTKTIAPKTRKKMLGGNGIRRKLRWNSCGGRAICRLPEETDFKRSMTYRPG
jgi:uncharacterized protein YcaQ